jgi:uncharacterized cupredoxin-like copper-binding protein
LGRNLGRCGLGDGETVEPRFRAEPLERLARLGQAGLGVAAPALRGQPLAVLGQDDRVVEREVEHAQFSGASVNSRSAAVSAPASRYARTRQERGDRMNRRKVSLRAAALLLVAAVASLISFSTGAFAAHRGARVRVTATEIEYKITLSRKSFRPDTYTFEAVNHGKLAHSLEIDGPGVKDRRLAGTLAPGATRSLTVRLRRGTYTLYCPVDGHEHLGMKVMLHVR